MGVLQVLLLILKILGILLASVLALVLISVALLLFVPLRYRLEGHKAEDYAVEARLSWLLHILRVNVKYASDSKLFYEVRLLWFLLLSNDEAWKAAHEEKKKLKAEKKAQKTEKKKQKQKEKRAKERAKQREKQQKAAGKQGGAAKGTAKPEKQLPQSSQKNTINAETQNADAKTAARQEQTTSGNENQTEENKKWFSRIYDKIKSVIEKIKNKLQSLVNTVKALWNKADAVITFLRDETNKAAFRASWSTLVKLLKHIGPTKIKGYLAFGTDDPATTGYILAVLGIFYGKFGKSFSIRPNFEEKQLETELRAKGRLRMSRLLYLAWKLWRNKDFKSLLDNIKQLKADIKTNGG